MQDALIIGLIVLVGELGLRVGMLISRVRNHESRLVKLELGQDRIFDALRELKTLMTNGAV